MLLEHQGGEGPGAAVIQPRSGPQGPRRLRKAVTEMYGAWTPSPTHRARNRLVTHRVLRHMVPKLVMHLRSRTVLHPEDSGQLRREIPRSTDTVSGDPPPVSSPPSPSRPGAAVCPDDDEASHRTTKEGAVMGQQLPWRRHWGPVVCPTPAEGCSRWCTRRTRTVRPGVQSRAP